MGSQILGASGDVIGERRKGRMIRLRLIFILCLTAVVALTACNKGGGGGGGGGDTSTPAPAPTPTPIPVGGGQDPPPEPVPVPSVADLDVDTNRDGVVDDGADESGEDGWSAAAGSVFYCNVDDEDNDNVEDSIDAVVNGAVDADDLARVIVRGYADAPAGGSVVVLVTPAAAQGKVRVFRQTGATWASVYGAGASFNIPLADVQAGDVTLGIEANKRIGPTWDGSVVLTLEIRDVGGALVGTDTVRLRCAPWIASTNLWTPQEVHVVNVGSNNVAYRNTLSAVCATAGVAYVEIPGGSYQNDRWIQDSSEDGTVLLPVAGAPRRVVPDVLQLARWRPVDAWCAGALFDPDFDLTRRFDPNQSSMNYGGNVECTGPYPGYPWGRILLGGGTSAPIGGGAPVTRRHVQAYRDFYNALALQGPHLEISTEWLAVGHVDEIAQVMPAPSMPYGWAILLSSPALAKTILEDVQAAGGGSLAVFQGRAGWQTTPNAILGDAALMAFNAEVQTRIDGVRSYLKTQIGITDAEILDVPTLYEDAGGGMAVALNPGVVNFVVMRQPNGTTQVIVPDPEGPDQPTDVWRAATTATLTSLGVPGQPVVVTYADVFFSYHTLMGEAHCGTNWVRIPPDEDWWDD